MSHGVSTLRNIPKGYSFFALSCFIGQADAKTNPMSIFLRKLFFIIPGDFLFADKSCTHLATKDYCIFAQTLFSPRICWYIICGTLQVSRQYQVVLHQGVSSIYHNMFMMYYIWTEATQFATKECCIFPPSFCIHRGYHIMDPMLLLNTLNIDVSWH